MGLGSHLRRRSKDTRLVVGVLALLLVFLTSIFYLLQRGRDIPATVLTNKVLLFVLWYINVVLILAVCFVLFRNLVKLLIERHHRILGAKFKTKLVLTYIGLSLIPVLLLFVIATEIVQGSVDRWFATPLAEVLERGRDVTNALNEEIEQQGLRDASRTLADLARFDLDEPAARPAVGRRMQELLADMELDVLAVYEGSDFVQGVVNPQAGITDLPEPGRRFLGEAAAEGEAVESVDGFGGRLVLTARSLPPRSGGRRRQGAAEIPPTVVVAGRLLPAALVAQIDALLQAYRGHRQLEVQKDEIKANHLLFFLMVTLLILLTSSWVGLYLAKRLTVPIQALADGTRRIGEGDLSHRVAVAADDELGILVGSFNRMAADLERNRDLLERANRELVATNERLADERALIAAVVENVAAGVLSIDAEDRIFTCNGAALKMLRQHEDQVVGRTVGEAWADPERSKLAAVLAGGHRRLNREVHLVLAAEWKTFEVKVTPMRDGAGGPAGRVVVLEDLSELIRAQKLAAWNEAARRIAHEIKNPLTPIRLSAERLLKKHRQGDPDLGRALEEGVETIVREVSTMQTMVDEFSRFARMPAPQPTAVDLERLFDETLHLYRDLKPGVSVVGEVATDVRSAWLDPEQIKRALINLLDNAIEATEPPGRVAVGAQRRNGHLEIQVRDSGRGIPREARDKLFLPHFSTKGRGTGLGLAIVHRIVSDHHGTIRVEDNPSGGTIFTLDLPLP